MLYLDSRTLHIESLYAIAYGNVSRDIFMNLLFFLFF